MNLNIEHKNWKMWNGSVSLTNTFVWTKEMKIVALFVSLFVQNQIMIDSLWTPNLQAINGRHQKKKSMKKIHFTQESRAHNIFFACLWPRKKTDMHIMLNTNEQNFHLNFIIFIIIHRRETFVQWPFLSHLIFVNNGKHLPTLYSTVVQLCVLMWDFVEYFHIEIGRKI